MRCYDKIGRWSKQVVTFTFDRFSYSRASFGGSLIIYTYCIIWVRVIIWPFKINQTSAIIDSRVQKTMFYICNELLNITNESNSK